ncbi:hypothetical protein N8I74_02760 [Chitiniphilus purpureus]|uniref:Peptidase S24/S26A/S26B/S26C domain-containing protein n=1 Tax=Chitiniphilus purpureus TaxID=2981137 RepID=A0ABY6DR46_9NEIS|nr:S24 family peptidase [Chitiniphilus sp. CD1]UXY15956.1 hypothetical protein N8I74_02760 [Chitiniphilus sp. CD1]
MNIYDARRNRLREVVESDKRFKGRPSRLAAFLGRQPSYLYRLLKDSGEDRKNLGEELAREFERELGLPYGWFDQDVLSEQARDRGITYQAGVNRGLSQRWVPLVPWAKVFSTVTAASKPRSSTEWVACPAPCSTRTFAVRHTGEAMAPDYRHGELLFVDPEQTARHGDDVIVRIDELTVFKRLHITPEGSYLVSLNPDFPDRIVAMPSQAIVLGCVIGSWVQRRA